MAYVALYRQWRPQDFDNLVGQEHISITLKNAIITNKIAHAYLFSGSRGTGKTSTAKILAKALNCQTGPTPQPCNKCLACREINSGSSMDVFEIDAASNRGIDEIRDLRETVKFAPVQGRYKVYIIDEVHMLTTEAFNALLKTLEEPPAHVVFILATTEPHKIPATIHSRCQRYDFRRIGVKQIQDRLSLVAEKNNINITADALRLIAVKADGAMRDALSILDQCLAFESKNIDADLVRKLLGMIGQEWIWSITESVAQKDAGTVLSKVDELINLGKDARQLLLELAFHMRNLMLYKAAPNLMTSESEIDSETSAVLKKQSVLFSHAEIVKILEWLHEAANESKWSLEPRIQAEMALISICHPGNGPENRLESNLESRADMANMATRLAALEAKLANFDFVNQPKEKISNKEYTKSPVKSSAVKAAPTKAELTEPWSKEINIAQEISKQTEKEFIKPEVDKEADIDKKSDAEADNQDETDLPKIWAAVLSEILSVGKRSVHACIMQGQLVELTGHEAQVEFMANFPKERTEKEDYRIIVEKALAKIVGRNLHLNCTVTGGRASRKKVKEEADKGDNLELPASSTHQTDGEHSALTKAKEMFGGKIMDN